MSTAEQGAAEQKKGRFEPKTPVNLDPPKDDPISLDYLEKCNGECLTISLHRLMCFPPSFKPLQAWLSGPADPVRQLHGYGV